MPRTDRLTLILGDQLTLDGPALAGLDPERDALVMVEAAGESTHVWSHKARITLFLSAMRHFRDLLRERGFTVHYLALGDSAGAGAGQGASDSASDSLLDRLDVALARLGCRELRVVEPGEYRLERGLIERCAARGIALEILPDTHFICSSAEFGEWAQRYGRQLRMEFFYREMRRRHGILLTADGEPEGGAWNFDAENRKAYPTDGPGLVPQPAFFAPDAITRAVIADVEARFPNHPGSLQDFAWPVTRADALVALERFVAARLHGFGDHQDAMWEALPFGWHSLLSASLNLHLIDPREVIAAAERAYREGRAPLPAVEGFIRQILGWREFIRGVYWLEMPGMASANHLGAHRSLPRWYWTGETRMACARDAIEQTLRYGYAHHIQRLMVTGLFALLAEVEPARVADWFLAVYVDAVEWAELPNVIGMALYADGGRFTSKPYVASGAYIQRMSNHCAGCHYAPTAKDAAKVGKPLCPFTTLYWNFLDKHETALAANPRTSLMAKQVQRLTPSARSAIKADALALFERLDAL
jgi:deoxyribodipyrimidine photolyase-related protein